MFHTISIVHQYKSTHLPFEKPPSKRKPVTKPECLNIRFKSGDYRIHLRVRCPGEFCLLPFKTQTNSSSHSTPSDADPPQQTQTHTPQQDPSPAPKSTAQPQSHEPPTQRNHPRIQPQDTGAADARPPDRFAAASIPPTQRSHLNHTRRCPPDPPCFPTPSTQPGTLFYQLRIIH